MVTSVIVGLLVTVGAGYFGWIIRLALKDDYPETGTEDAYLDELEQQHAAYLGAWTENQRRLHQPEFDAAATELQVRLQAQHHDLMRRWEAFAERHHSGAIAHP